MLWVDLGGTKVNAGTAARWPVGVRTTTSDRASHLRPQLVRKTYRRIDARRFHYTSEGGFEALLRYDASGLIVDYPGIARRFA